MDQLPTSIKQALSHLLPTITSRLSSPTFQRPLILGLTGLQGSGKSTWATHLVTQLSQSHSLKTITVSLDDFYLPHSSLQSLASGTNTLHKTRGQPGTHDTELARNFFSALKDPSIRSVRIPAFDKSAYHGTGDRAPEAEWEVVEKPVDVVIFEGWCVGFQPVGLETIKEKREEAVRGEDSAEEPTKTLGRHSVGNLVEVNGFLGEYCGEDGFMGIGNFDVFLQLDTERLGNVYGWRREQEHKLIESKGSGMSGEQVKEFIMGYMPAYELYLDDLRKGLFRGSESEKRHLRVKLGRSREVLGMEWCDGKGDES